MNLPFNEPDMARRAQPDPRARCYITPARVVWQQGAVDHTERLLQVGSGQITLDNVLGCTLRGDGDGASLLLDFGRELHGGLQIAVSELTPGEQSHGKTVPLRVRFGESVSEAMSEMAQRGAQNDHAPRDMVVLAPWLGSVEVGSTGFRFVRIDLVNPGTSVTLKFVRAVLLYRDLPYQGSFQCSDERLTRIWQTGAYTAHLNMQDYLWDGIKRDRLVWIGDMHPETQTIATVFGDVDVVRRSLDLLRDETPLPRWMNGISSYTMWWAMIHEAWYNFHGDLGYLREQQPYLAQLMRELAKHIGPDGAETLPEPGRFLDWPSSEDPAAIHAGLHALLLMTITAGERMCRVLGDDQTGAVCADAAAKLRRHVPDCGQSKQAAALMALAGLGDPVELNREVMAVDGARRLSTFYGYYVLRARALAGDVQGCLDVIREYWGGMLDLGATTFWEDFNLDWTHNAARIDELVPPGKRDIHADFGAYCYEHLRHSLCHGWASGPTPWLTENVLGIRVTKPGCTEISVNPQLGDLQWAEGTFPTPHGVVRVRHERGDDGAIKSVVQAPVGVKIAR